jgi:hypothetical protein
MGLCAIKKPTVIGAKVEPTLPIPLSISSERALLERMQLLPALLTGQTWSPFNIRYVFFAAGDLLEFFLFQLDVAAPAGLGQIIAG